MIAIHDNDSEVLFHYRWVAYCEQNSIPYKRVNCYASNIVEQLKDCQALLFHYHQSTPADIVMAKPLLYALEQSDVKVFPDFNTAWHFDDKLGQKYLLEALGIDIVPTWVFYNRNEASNWAAQASFPKVFKLRGGAGAQNVQLVKSNSAAQSIIKQAFGKGFLPYARWGSLAERWRKFRLGQANWVEIVKGIVRLFIPPPYAKVMGNEVAYVYFQEFIPNNDTDTRVIVIDGKAFGIVRMVRENDFRASGSGNFTYDHKRIDKRCIELSFEYTRRLKGQCVVFDYVFGEDGAPLLVEISYGFSNKAYDGCEGYWDEELNWHPGSFNPYGWMIELIQKEIATNA